MMMQSVVDVRPEDSTVGRGALVDRLTASLRPEGSTRMLLLYGEAGVGKSSVAAAIIAWWGEHGGVSSSLGADLTREPSWDGEPHLLVIDAGADRLPADPDAWRGLLDGLGPTDRVLAVARDAHVPLSLDDAHLLEVQVPPLGALDAASILERAGVPAARHGALIAWAAGLPLLLVLGAHATLAGPRWDPRDDVEPRELMSRMVRRLGLPTTGLAADAVLAAALARTVDRGLLAAALPSADPDEAFALLADCTLLESTGDRLRLQYGARRAVLALMALDDPQAAGEMRCRMADHLFAVRESNGTSVAIDLAHLTTSVSMALGFRAHEGLQTRVARFTDAAEVRQRLAAAGREAWWNSIEPYFAEALDRIRVTVDRHGTVLAYCIAMTPESAPPCAFEDPMMRAWIAHAMEGTQDRNVLLWRDTADLRAPAGGPGPGSGLSVAQAVAHAEATVSCGLGNPARAYAPVHRPVGDTLNRLRTLRASHVAALDTVVGGEQVQCHVLNFGTHGLLGALRGLVQFEAGRGGSPFEANDATPREVLEEAVREYQRPVVLARSPLAIGTTNAERTASVRELVDRAVANAFGTSHAEELLREVLRVAYINPVGGHERSAYDLNLSRTTYFRKLRVALERVVTQMQA